MYNVVLISAIEQSDSDIYAHIFHNHWKRPWCWERLKAGGQGDDRGWDGWMAPWTRWTWLWASSGSWWWTGKTGVLQSMGSQRAGHDSVTELICTYSFLKIFFYIMASHRILNIVFCVIQSGPGFFFFIIHSLNNSFHLLIPSSHSIPPHYSLRTASLFSVPIIRCF